METVKETIKREKLIVIARGVETKEMMYTAEALIKGGIRVLEITLNSPNSLKCIELLRKEFGSEMCIGAGTVKTDIEVERATTAGATFIVTPNTDEDVMKMALQKEVPIFPGAMTPTEVMQAWQLGAAAIKLFPNLGISYLQQLQGPFREIPFIVLGGIDRSNLEDYLMQNVYGIGIGSYLIHKPTIEAGNYNEITRRAKELVEMVRLQRKQ